MKEKLFAIIVIFILMSSPALAICPDPEDPTCPPEEQSPEDKFKDNPTAENFDLLPNPTAEDLKNVAAPTLKNFNGLGNSQQALYLEDKYNPDFAQDFFETKGNELAKAPTAANQFLQGEFGNKDITFSISQGMRYSGSPSPSISVGNTELKLQAGASKGQIPPGSSSVRFDRAKNEFVFEPRGVEVKGQSIVLNEDGSFTFDDVGSIIDPQTGAQIDISAGSNIRFTSDGATITDECEGVVSDVEFKNFEGILTITGSVISSENSIVLRQGSEIKGKFVASLQNNNLVGVTLLSQESSYKDSFGKLNGEGNIEFYGDETWKSVKTTGESELEYGSFVKEGKQDRQHLFSGEFDVNFDREGNPASSKLISKQSKYQDRIEDVSISHNSNTANLYFGDNYIETVGSIIRSIDPGESLSILGSKGTVVGYGKLGVETSDIVYDGQKDTTTFSRAMDGNNEQIRIDSEEEGEIAKLSKKIKIGDIIKGELSEEVRLKATITKENGEIELKLDARSAAFLAGIEKSPINVLGIGNNLVVSLGEKKFFGITTEAGMFYQTEGKMPVGILSPKNVGSFLGDDLLNVEARINDLNREIEAAKKAGANAIELVKERDSIEFLLHHQSLEGLLENDNYEEAIKRTNEFLEQHPGTPIVNDVKLSLAEIYTNKAASTEIGPISQGVLTLGGERYPLQFSSTMIDGREVVTGWSPDGINWMKLNELTVKGGEWDGDEPREENQKLILELSRYGSLNLLETEAKKRGAALTGWNAKYLTDNYETSQRDFQAAKGLYQGIIESDSENVNARVGLAGLHMQQGNNQFALDEYEVLVENPDIRVRSQGLTGKAMSLAQIGNLESALYYSAEAIKANPQNPAARQLHRSLQLGVLNGIDNALAAEGGLTTKMFEAKLGLGEYEGGAWEGFKQIFGNTGRIIVSGVGDTMAEHPTATKVVMATGVGVAGGGIGGAALTAVLVSDADLEDNIFRWGNNLQIVHNGIIEEIDGQQAGMMIMKAGIGSGKYTLQDFYYSNVPQRRRMIKEIMGIDDRRRIVELNAMLSSALTNPDVKLAAQNGRLTDWQKETITGMGGKGTLHTFSYEEPPRPNSYVPVNFMFKTGDNYISKEALEFTWRDHVFEGTDLKNFAMFTLPGAQWSSHIGYLSSAEAAVTFSKTVTVAQGALKGAGAIGKFAIGSERAARLSASAAALKKSMAANSVVKWLTKARWVTEGVQAGKAANVLDKSIKIVGSAGGEEILEEAAGRAAGKLAGAIDPKLGAAVAIITEMAISHGKVFEGVTEGVEELGERAAKRTLKTVFDPDGKVMAVGRSFRTQVEVDDFVTSMKLKADELGETFVKSTLEPGVFSVGGRKYVGLLEGAELSSLGGVKVGKIVDVNIDASQARAAAKHVEALQSMDPDLVNLKKIDTSHVSDQFEAMKYQDNPQGSLLAKELELMENAEGNVKRIDDLRKNIESGELDDEALRNAKIELDNLEHTTISPATRDKFYELQEKDVLEMSGAESVEFKKIQEEITFKTSYAATDPTEHRRVIQEQLGTAELGHAPIAEADVIGSMKRNQQQIIDSYKKGITTKGGNIAQITEGQAKHLEMMADTQNRLLKESIESGEIARRASDMGISEQELVQRFNNQFADNLQTSVINDGIILDTPTGTLTLGTGGSVRFRESNGMDHALGNMQRSLKMMDNMEGLSPMQKLEVMQAQILHDMAKGSALNNAGAMTQLDISGELSASHAAAAAKYVDDQSAKFKGLFGDEGHDRVRYIASHHSATAMLEPGAETGGVLQKQLNVMTIADNAAGTHVRAASGELVADKLVNAMAVQGNQDIFSKLHNLDEYVDELKPLGITRADAVDDLRRQALNNIDDAPGLSAQQRREFKNAIEQDLGEFAARANRRINSAGEFDVIGIDEAGTMRVSVRTSDVADELEMLHPGMKYDFQKGTTSDYWDRVTYRNIDGTSQRVRFKDGNAFEELSDGSLVDLGVSRKDFIKKGLRDKVVSGNAELVSAEKFYSSPGSLTDPLKGAELTDKVGMHIRFGTGDAASAATEGQKAFLGAARRNMEVIDDIRVAQRTLTTLSEELKGIDSLSSFKLQDLQDQISTGGWDIDTSALNEGMSGREAIEKLEEMTSSYTKQRWRTFFGME